MSDPKIKRIGDLLGGGDVEREVAPGVSPELAAELHQHFAGLTDSHRARLIERWGEVIRPIGTSAPRRFGSRAR
jgi:hypothetical protein